MRRPPALNHMAYEAAHAWTDMVVNLLRLQTSDDKVFVPPGPAATAALHGCQRNDCTASIDTHGVDLGVDTVAGGNRDDAKLKARAVDNKPRIARGNIVVKTLRGIGAAFSHINKAQNYSSQRLGQAPCLRGLRHRC